MSYLPSGKSVERKGAHKYTGLRAYCNKLFFKVTEHRPLFWVILLYSQKLNFAPIILNIANHNVTIVYTQFGFIVWSLIFCLMILRFVSNLYRTK